MSSVTTPTKTVSIIGSAEIRGTPGGEIKAISKCSAESTSATLKNMPSTLMLLSLQYVFIQPEMQPTEYRPTGYDD